jgi:phosphoglucomutase
MEARKAKGIANANDMVITTIVTSEMINEVAKQNKVACYNVLKGLNGLPNSLKKKRVKKIM